MPFKFQRSWINKQSARLNQQRNSQTHEQKSRARKNRWRAALNFRTPTIPSLSIAFYTRAGAKLPAGERRGYSRSERGGFCVNARGAFERVKCALYVDTYVRVYTRMTVRAVPASSSREREFSIFEAPSFPLASREALSSWESGFFFSGSVEDVSELGHFCEWNLACFLRALLGSIHLSMFD